jgi:acetoacetyl-CoA synthetase
VILQHKKTSVLHNSLTSDDIVFQYSSTSWVLWNIMIGHLSVGPTLILYDGSPLWPSAKAMAKIAEYHRVTYWGCSPRYLQELEMTRCAPKVEFDLSSLRMVQTGGSHLGADQYHWFYRAFPPSVHLTSVTGGTDLVTSWIGTDPAGPLYPGEIQLPMLGQDVDVADPVTGESVKMTGRHGEFVCRQPFPSMPVFFWGDSDGSKYKSTYFDKFENCWAQHDWASYNPRTKGWQIHGRRSVTPGRVIDAVNPHVYSTNIPILVTACSTPRVFALDHRTYIPSPSPHPSTKSSHPHSASADADRTIPMNRFSCSWSCSQVKFSPVSLRSSSRQRFERD